MLLLQIFTLYDVVGHGACFFDPFSLLSCGYYSLLEVLRQSISTLNFAAMMVMHHVLERLYGMVHQQEDGVRVR